MRLFLIFPSIIFSIACHGQHKNIIGTFTNGLAFPKLAVTFHADSTFEYTSTQEPTFFSWRGFSEKGKWLLSGDTITLNPQLSKRPFVESDLVEEEMKDDTSFLLTFNHIKRYFDHDGHVVRSDTGQIDRLDYAFNKLSRKRLTRVGPQPTIRCAFAGYIPKEVITTSRTIAVSRPAERLKSIFIGCYELQGTKEFIIKNSGSNHLTLNVYSNYYQDGQIRQLKFLIKNEHVIYTAQRPDGTFLTGANTWFSLDEAPRLKRQKTGS